MENKNILHVFSVSFSITYFVGEQFIYLAKKKNNKYFVSCSDSEELFRLSNSLHFFSLPVKISRSINPLSDIKAIIRLYKRIKENKIDKVVGHSPKGAMVAMIAAKLARVSERIYFRHGIFYETSKGVKRILLKNIDRLSGNLATKVVCVSNAVKQISEDDNLNSKNKNIILGRGTCNGVDTYKKFNPALKDENEITQLREKFNLKKEDYVVGFVGRIVKDKGIEELVEAWKNISNKYSYAKLLLVGPIEERDAVSQLLKEENFREDIEYLKVNQKLLYLLNCDTHKVSVKNIYSEVNRSISKMKIPMKYKILLTFENWGISLITSLFKKIKRIVQ